MLTVAGILMCTIWLSQELGIPDNRDIWHHVVTYVSKEMKTLQNKIGSVYEVYIYPSCGKLLLTTNDDDLQKVNKIHWGSLGTSFWNVT